jgi:hypothetical protein
MAFEFIMYFYDEIRIEFNKIVVNYFNYSYNIFSH